MYMLRAGGKIKFTRNELDDILESLQFSRMAFENYSGYPSYEFKRERLSGNHELMVKVRKMRNAAKKSNVSLTVDICQE